MVTEIGKDYTANIRMFRIVRIDVINQCFRLISDARRQINGAFSWRTYHIANVFCDKIALPNLV